MIKDTKNKKSPKVEKDTTPLVAKVDISKVSTPDAPKALCAYGFPGTTQVIYCEPHLAPKGVVAVINPTPDNPWQILNVDGTWIDNPNVSVDTKRKAAYLDAYPIEKQLEAIMDKNEGKDLKYKSMTDEFALIKSRYPKEK